MVMALLLLFVQNREVLSRLELLFAQNLEPQIEPFQDPAQEFCVTSPLLPTQAANTIVDLLIEL
jgi:hypothetical protein